MKTNYEFHPFAAIWPLLEGEELEKLTADIKARGQILPILLYQDMVLDGRNRENACKALGIEPRYEQARAASDDEALDLVVSMNDRRRHLCIEARGIAAARLANLQHGTNRFSRKKVETSREISTFTLKQAGKLLGVGESTVANARTILAKGDPETIKAVEKGKLGIRSTAEKLRPRVSRSMSARITTSKMKKPTREEREREVRRRGKEMFDGLTLKGLTPEEIGEPELANDHKALVEKYGRVRILTKVQVEKMASRDRVADWIVLANEARKFAAAEVPDDIYAWAQSPRKRQKLERWLTTLESIAEIIAQIRSRIHPTGGIAAGDLERESAFY